MKKIIVPIFLIIIVIFAWSPWVTQSFVEKAIEKNIDCSAQISSFDKKMFGASLKTDCGPTEDGIMRLKSGFVPFWGSFIVTTVSK